MALCGDLPSLRGEVRSLVFNQKCKGCNMKTEVSDDEDEVDDSDHHNGNGRQCCKHVGLLKVGKDSHPLYVSGRCQNNGSRKIVVCDILWGMRPIDCLRPFLTARARGINVELKLAATAKDDFGEEFSYISPESLRSDLLDLSSNGHTPIAVLPPAVSVVSSPLNVAYA